MECFHEGVLTELCLYIYRRILGLLKRTVRITYSELQSELFYSSDKTNEYLAHLLGTKRKQAFRTYARFLLTKNTTQIRKRVGGYFYAAFFGPPGSYCPYCNPLKLGLAGQ